MRSYLFGALGLVAATSLLGCSSDSTSGRPRVVAKKSVAADAPAAPMPVVMAASNKCETVRDLVVDTLVHQMVVGGYNYGYGYNGYNNYAATGMAMEEAKSAAEPAPAPPSASMKPPANDSSRAGVTSAPVQAQPAIPAGPGHYTTTNVQERNVDEADIVKTDGKYVYTLRNNELLIAKTWPVEKTTLAARVTFKTIAPQQMYLQGDNVIVQGYAVGDSWGNPYPYGATRIFVIDAKDRERPKLSTTYDVDGANLNSRVVGDDLYLVQNGALQIPPKLYETAQKLLAGIPRADHSTLRPWEIQSRLAKTLRTTLINDITQHDIEAMLPKIHTASGKVMLACADLYVPPGNMQLGLTAVARISVSSKHADLVGAMVAGGQIYASTEALYVTAPAYNWNNQGYASYGTQVHQFSLTGKQGKPTYVASGVVDGQLLNQFSMSEWKGDLRIATTDWNWNNGQQGGNHLSVLRPSGRNLKVIGEVRGLAKGEQIYSGRMFGDKGYLVTFRQTDPLFTLDLSDPRNPRVVGELKINGFSSYIHPMGNNLLLTIGQDATSEGRIKGMHLQVFDVSKPESPTRKFHETFTLENGGGYANSIAQHDHHAFTYDPVTGTLAIPMQQYGNNGQMFNGLIVYHLDGKTGFKSLGRIEHGDLADKMLDQMCEQGKQQGQGSDSYYCQKQYRAQARHQFQIDRSIVVDKYLLSLGSAGLAIHTLAGLDSVAQLSWARVTEQTAIAQ